MKIFPIFVHHSVEVWAFGWARQVGLLVF
jgi:hypothetical protein